MGSPGAPRRASGDRLSAPVDRIEVWPLSKLRHSTSNPNLHSDEQVALIAASMKRHGQTQLVIVDGDKGDKFGEIIAGSGRASLTALSGPR